MYHHTATESLYCLCGAKIGWTPTLAGVSYQFCFIRFSICLQCKISWSSVFSTFFPHNVSHHKVRKFDPSLWEKSSDRLDLEGLKTPKVRFLGFSRKSYPFRYAFLLQHERVYVFMTFCKNNMFTKIWFLSYGPKTWKQIRMQDSLNYNISQKTWGVKLNFLLWLKVQESTKY